MHKHTKGLADRTEPVVSSRNIWGAIKSLVLLIPKM